jgi:hypothetical protein
VTATTEIVRELAVLEPWAPVLSVHLRTDPRDPSNGGHRLGWLVALRNGLRDASQVVEEQGPRENRLALRELRASWRTTARARPRGARPGLSWFLTADGSLDERVVLQLPPREHVVRWDGRPFVSPLVDVADRGRPAGLVLITAEAIRLPRWEGGRVEEPERSLYELEPGEWRDYSAYTMTNPSRAAAGLHVATFAQRVE